MGTSFVSINNFGFWMEDSILQLWLRIIALHIDESTDKESTTYEIRDKWLLASKFDFTGCVPIALEDIVSTEEGKTIVLKAIKSLVNSLYGVPIKLDKHILKVLGNDYILPEDITIKALIDVGKAFIDLIEGRVQTTAKDDSYMPGSRVDF